MKLKDYGASWPHVERSLNDRRIAGSDGLGRLDVPDTADAEMARLVRPGVDGTPVPLRFPWLNRPVQVAHEAAGQRAGFEAIPVLGGEFDELA